MADTPIHSAANADLRVVEVAGALGVLSIMIGKATLPGLDFLPDPLQEVRILATFGGLILAFAGRTRAVTGSAAGFLIATCALLAYLFARGLNTESGSAFGKNLDLLYLSLHVVTFVLVAQRSEGRRAILIAAAALAGLHLVATGCDYVRHMMSAQPLYGLGWGDTFGTSITFYRNMIVGCAASLCIGARYERFRVAAVAVAAVFFISCLASMQKAALLGAVLAAFFFGKAVLCFLPKKTVAPVLGLVVIALVLASAVFGGRVADRFSLMFSTVKLEGMAQAAALPTDEPGYQLHDELAVTFPTVDAPTTVDVTSSYCVFERAPARPDRLVETCRQGVVSDRSGRSVLWIEALRDFISAPLWGIGYGAYEVIAIDTSYLWPDSYYYPHNFVLEIMAEGGLVGLASLVLALVAARIAIPATISEPVRLFAAGLVAFMVATGMMAGDFYDTRIVWVVAACLAGSGLDQRRKLATRSA